MVSKIKVAMISDWYPPKIGGVETLVHELSKHMSERSEVDLEVITQDFSEVFSFDEKYDQEDGIRVRRIAGITDPIWKIYFHPELPFKMRELFKEEDYDVVHTHHFFTPLSVLSTAVAKEMHPKRKCVVAANHTYHALSDSILFKIPKIYASYAAESADRICVGSDAQAKLARDITDSGKIRRVGYGVSLDGFNPEKRSREIREELGGERDILALFTGRFAKRKGLINLIKAAQKVKRKINNFKLILVGKGPREDRCRKLVKKLNLSDTVVFAGFRSKEDLQKIYATCDFAVFPSTRDESFGRVIPEAMASEIPYIATDIPGYDEVHVEGAGYLVAPGDIGALVEKMTELCKDESLRVRVGEKGRKVAEEKFNWEKVVDKTLEVYNEVLSEL